MSTAVISYSWTGNNDALASGVARALSAEHIKITEAKPRTMAALMLDMLFSRTPRVQPQADILEKYDRVLFVGPVWMGQVASPLRPYLKHVKDHPRKYAFACISGGGLNPNPKLAADLAKWAGTAPAAYLDLHIADLLPQEPKPDMKATSSYRLNDVDKAKLVEAVVRTVVSF